MSARIALALLFAHVAQAAPSHGTAPRAVAPSFAPLDWWSVTPAQVRRAPCRRAPFSDAEIEAGIRALVPGGDKKVSVRTNGLVFENESETLVKLFQKLVGGTDLSSSCRTVICALKDPAIFGPKLGPRLLFMLGRYGFNGSHHLDDDASKWTDAEIGEILSTLSDFPPNVLPLNEAGGIKERPLVRYLRGHELRPANQARAAAASSNIYVSDIWSQQAPEIRQSIVLHEVGHVISLHYGLHESPEWMKFSGWSTRKAIKNGESVETHLSAKPQTLVSAYGATKPEEDFAESVAAYRYNSTSLKKRSPAKYDFLKETVFDGLEYTSAATCAPANAITERAAKETPVALGGLLKPSPVRAEFLKRARLKCPEMYVYMITTSIDSPARKFSMLDECLFRAAEGAVASKLPVLSALKHKKFIQEAVVRAQRARFKPKLSEAARSLYGDLFADLKEALVELITVRDQAWQTELATGSTPPPSRFCDQYGDSHGIDKQVMDARFGAEARAHGNGAVLKDFLKDTCTALYNGKPARPLGEAQIRSFVDNWFATKKLDFPTFAKAKQITVPPVKDVVVPTPIAEPVPVPVPTPAPTPTPIPVPTPEPVTTPTPAPVTTPTPETSPTDAGTPTELPPPPKPVIEVAPPVTPESTEPPPLPPPLPPPPVETTPAPIPTPEVAPSPPSSVTPVETAPAPAQVIEETSPPPLPPPPAPVPDAPPTSAPAETTTPPTEAVPAPTEGAPIPGT